MRDKFFGNIVDIGDMAQFIVKRTTIVAQTIKARTIPTTI